MKLIKLDAIDSTNDFLKLLSNQEFLENFTMVTAENQTKGKGQRGAIWHSENGKNLTLSILIKDFATNNKNIFNLSVVTSLAIIMLLEDFNIPELSIKWPNDIMSCNKKIGGILIENTLKNGGTINSVVGIGLNINQINFDSLPKATSLAIICKKQFDKTLFPNLIALKMQDLITSWPTKSHFLWKLYFNKLFKKGIPMAFKNANNKIFMGIIVGVSCYGQLQVKLENDTIASFDIKEIQMLF